jgi:hypothetical protein
MSTSQVWSVATDEGAAALIGRHIGRSTEGMGRVTARIGYTNKHGARIVRKWAEDGVMIEAETDKLQI